MHALITYVRDALEELRHVRWPTRQQAVRFSLIVLAFTGACTVVFGIVDYSFTALFEYLLSLA